MIVTGAQIRAGRALLGWSRDDLARAAELHGNAIAYWERKGPQAQTGASRSFAIHHIARALMAAGVEFFSAPTPGVRFATFAHAEQQALN